MIRQYSIYVLIRTYLLVKVIMEGFSSCLIIHSFLLTESFLITHSMLYRTAMGANARYCTSILSLASHASMYTVRTHTCCIIPQEVSHRTRVWC